MVFPGGVSTQVSGHLSPGNTGGSQYLMILLSLAPRGKVGWLNSALAVIFQEEDERRQKP